MEQNKSYFSLGGLSGILLGAFGLFTVYVIYVMTGTYGDGFEGSSQLPIALLEIGIMVLTVLMVFISLVILWVRAKRRVKKQHKKLWNSISKKVRLHTLILLLIFIIILLIIAYKGYYSLVTWVSLFLYSILLFDISRFSLKRLRYLAVVEMILAIITYYVYDKEMLFLALGFGVFPFIYGILTFDLSKKKAV